MSTQSNDWFDPSELRRLYWEEDFTVAEIAAKKGMSEKRMSHHMDRLGVERRTNDGNYRRSDPMPWRCAQLMYYLHVEKGLNGREIADELDTTSTTANTWLRRHDIR